MDLSTRFHGGAGGAAVLLVIAAMPRWRAGSLSSARDVVARARVETWESEIDGPFQLACKAAHEAGAIGSWGVRQLKSGKTEGWVRPIPEAVAAGELGVEAHLWPRMPATVAELRSWAVDLGGESFARAILGEPGPPIPDRTWQRWLEGEPDSPIQNAARAALRDLYWAAQ